MKQSEISLNQTIVQRTHWRDYYELTKPKVVLLLLLTAVVGMCLSTPGWVPVQPLILGTLGIGLLSSAAAVINHVVDYRIDAIMARTLRRPIPKGKVSPQKAITFAIALAVIGFVILFAGVNPLTAWLTLASLFGYAVVYTMFLKRATPQNIVIGGLAGAMPPLLGWTAVTGELHAHALLLVMIIYTWTPPHFWALAIHRKEDYAKADVPMLPVTHGLSFTKTSVLLYTFLLTLVCLLPYLVGMSGVIYLLGTLILNLAFFVYAWQLKFNPQTKTAWQMFKFSIYHLMILFIVILVDHYMMFRVG